MIDPIARLAVWLAWVIALLRGWPVFHVRIADSGSPT